MVVGRTGHVMVCRTLRSETYRRCARSKSKVMFGIDALGFLNAIDTSDKTKNNHLIINLLSTCVFVSSTPACICTFATSNSTKLRNNTGKDCRKSDSEFRRATIRKKLTLIGYFPCAASVLRVVAIELASRTVPCERVPIPLAS